MVPTEPREAGLDQNAETQDAGEPHITPTYSTQTLLILCSSPLGSAPCLAGIQTQGGKGGGETPAPMTVPLLSLSNTAAPHEVLVGALLLVSGDVLEDGQEGLKSSILEFISSGGDR